MSESTPKFSPPPWHRDQWGHIIDSAGEPVQFKGVSIAMGKDATAEANTDLATAAPALYAACKGFVALFRGSDMRPEDECHELYGAMIAAVAKVEEGGGP